MANSHDYPLIVQGDFTILLEVDSPHYETVRDRLLGFAELIRSPEHVHTYRISALSVWNALSAGSSPEGILQTLREFSRYPVPENITAQIRQWSSRFGCLRLSRQDDILVLAADGPALATEISRLRTVEPLIGRRLSFNELKVPPENRGRLKQALIKAGFPVEDLAGYATGEGLEVALREITASGRPFRLRRYQLEAAEAFDAGGSIRGGSGVVLLPCGAGKTIVGMACMSRLQTSTLILTTGVTAARQWIAELLDKTTLEPDQVGEYSGSVKEIRPVTVTTYQILTYRKQKDGGFLHFDLFDRRNWGLIVYDEVHLLPAPVFQATAALQARRRLGLTATLVREDGREDEVFALIGPKKTDVPWKRLEAQGWISQASCCEVRVPMSAGLQMKYALAEPREKFRLASENPAKADIVRTLLERHAGEPALLLGMYLDQMQSLSEELGIPLISGRTPQERRDRLYAQFRSGELPALALTKVGNFSVDLPDAAVAIQVSGTFGSRQEEAQRLGRVLRPKPGVNQAHFYTLVSRDSVEQEMAWKRQLFLCEQGYEYRLRDAEEELTPYGHAVAQG